MKNAYVFKPVGNTPNAQYILQICITGNYNGVATVMLLNLRNN